MISEGRYWWKEIRAETFTLFYHREEGGGGTGPHDGHLPEMAVLSFAMGFTRKKRLRLGMTG